jgi:hydroxymethylglutaryl-CoA reductase
MAIEEPSVVAAASHAAKLARINGGFKTSSTPPVMIGQIQLTGVTDPKESRTKIIREKANLIRMANELDPMLVKAGGGARELEVRIIQTINGPMIIIHLLVDCRDAMGANAVNTMVEGIAPYIERLTGGRVYLRILSNLAVHRLARAEAVFDKDAIGGGEVVEGILNAYAFALADPFRCATHNKGIMNGIDAVVIATGNDWRAINAGAHAYVSYKGEGYKPLTVWDKNADGDIVGKIELPLALGLIGGATAVHPTAKLCVKILGVKSASELAEVIAAVGLAQNFAALRALATEGIQRGHMELHARNIAITAGAVGAEIDRVVEQMVREKKVRLDRAKELIAELRK